MYFAILLPPVIFLAGLHLDLAGFFSRFYSICVFAFLGTFTSAVFIALPVYVLCLIPGMPHFGFIDSFLLGSILSATDSGR
jgi:NhaP-type Na+/H+ or K+/H+ antiporter